MSDENKEKIAAAFHQALLARDWDLLRTIMTADVSWTLPGENQISGTAAGVDEVIARAELIAAYGPSFELKYVLYSRDNLALAIHNQARRGDLVLDEHLATVCTLTDGRISRIETYLSDVPGMNAFFADLP